MHGCLGSALPQEHQAITPQCRRVDTKRQTSQAEGASQAAAAATGQQAPLHSRHEVEGAQAIQVISLSAKDWR